MFPGGGGGGRGGQRGRPAPDLRGDGGPEGVPPGPAGAGGGPAQDQRQQHHSSARGM
jgi:hypothetical protein